MYLYIRVQMYVYLQVYVYTHIRHTYVCVSLRAVMKLLASANGRFAKRSFPFRETFAKLSRYLWRNILHAFHDDKDHAYNSLFPGHGPRPKLEAFSFVVAIAELDYRGSFAKFCEGFLKTDILTTCVT